VALGDLNGDGRADAVVANLVSPTVSVLLGDGTGGLGAPASFGVGAVPFSVAIGDLDRDGKADLAVANRFSVSVLLGDGAGGFGAPADFPAGDLPSEVAIGDLNHDGKADLAVTDYDSDTVSVLLGDGAGGFGAPADFPTGDVPHAVAAGDLNRDGKADLAVANLGSGNVSVLLGDGAGGFGAATNLAVGSSPHSVAIGDLNHDGRADVAVANFNSHNVSVLLGDGAGGFGAATNFPAGYWPYSVALGDLNSDGNTDLAVTNYHSSRLSILLGDGAGGLGAATDFPTGDVPYSVAVGDLNHDGMVDLAVANLFSDSVTILTNTTKLGEVWRRPATSFAAGDGPHAVAIGDLDRDGRADLVAANSASNDVSVLLGDGASGFGGATSFAAGDGPSSVAIGDINHDGKADVAVANSASNDVSVLLGDGAGGFGGATSFAAGDGPSSVAIGDINRDGKADLGVANHRSGTVAVLPGDGTGNFGAATDFAAGDGPSSVAIGDVNRDGKADVAVANSASDNVSVLLSSVSTIIYVSPACPDGENGWYKTPPEVNFARDGTGTTYYAWEDGERQSYTETVTRDWSATGAEHTLYYYSQDASGNVEPTRSVDFRVDDSGPIGPSLVFSTSHTQSGWSRDRTVDVWFFGAGDDASGVDGYSLDWTASPTSSPDATLDAQETMNSVSSPPLQGGVWYFHLRTKDNAGNWNSPVHLGPFRIATTRLSASASASLVSYRAPVTVSGVLTSDGSGMLGRTDVTLWASTNRGISWSKLATATGLGSEYSATVNLIRNTHLRLRFAGDATHAPCVSTQIPHVRARALLSTPTAPPIVKRSVTATFTGTVAPFHAGKTRVELYRRVGTRFVHYETLQARNVPFSGITKWILRAELPYAGTWRIRARDLCAGHAPSTSAYKGFFVVR
jgi:hypothetical protein